MVQHVQVKTGWLLIYVGNKKMQTRLDDVLQKGLLNLLIKFYKLKIKGGERISPSAG